MIKALRKLPNGRPMPFRGSHYSLTITKSMGKPLVKIINNKLLVNFYQEYPPIPVQVPLVKWYRHKAKAYIPDRAASWADKMRVRYNKIFIKDQESRWGSCSSLKNINFNWRIMMAPDEVIDYLLIHELAHLKEMNHSKSFWTLVKSFDPNYKEHISWLKDNEHPLFLLLPKLPVDILNKITFYVE